MVGQTDLLGLDPQCVRVERQQPSDVTANGGAVRDGGDVGGGEQLLRTDEAAGLDDPAPLAFEVDEIDYVRETTRVSARYVVEDSERVFVPGQRDGQDSPAVPVDPAVGGGKSL
ncbi:hypothetical protein ABZT43_42365 [Streptomyces sp. NPDC005349]|uniref:hypothetical protein n=1 Tax=Streptomyces sp. NPDC005349 TaxID=3157037 RepID=UPI0033B0A94C